MGLDRYAEVVGLAGKEYRAPVERDIPGHTGHEVIGELGGKAASADFRPCVKIEPQRQWVSLRPRLGGVSGEAFGGVAPSVVPVDASPT